MFGRLFGLDWVGSGSNRDEGVWLISTPFIYLFIHSFMQSSSNGNPFFFTDQSIAFLFSVGWVGM